MYKVLLYLYNFQYSSFCSVIIISEAGSIGRVLLKWFKKIQNEEFFIRPNDMSTYWI